MKLSQCDRLSFRLSGILIDWQAKKPTNRIPFHSSSHFALRLENWLTTNPSISPAQSQDNLLNSFLFLPSHFFKFLFLSCQLFFFFSFVPLAILPFVFFLSLYIVLFNSRLFSNSKILFSGSFFFNFCFPLTFLIPLITSCKVIIVCFHFFF